MIHNPHPLLSYLLQEEYISRDSELTQEELNAQIVSILKTQNQNLMSLRSENMQLKKSVK